ncbi:lantibiotic dehydratase [Longispora sp. NPDC051575]|uniref:lantibiotic dehydratase n=1 Tax=Longispora sp. NPDC051575 TaxID=3154943 RepID=UPI0034132C66
MPIRRAGFQPAGPVLVRASTRPDDLDLTPPDPAADTREALAWLRARWAREDFQVAVATASPDLASRIRQLMENGGASVEAKAVRRAVTATYSYLLRWSRRSTPFGLFAAVGVATGGPAAATFGTAHRAVARADADWLALLMDRLEQHEGLRDRLTVVADSAAFLRDRRLITDARPHPGRRTPGQLRDESTAFTRPVQMAVTLAKTPIGFDSLARAMAARSPKAAPERIVGFLHGLIDGGVLLTNLRPPMTAVDGLAHVLDVLTSAGAADFNDLADLVGQLRVLHADLTSHNTTTDPREAATVRGTVTAVMRDLFPEARHQLMVDLRLDGQVSLPPQVLADAARAAQVLVATGTRPFGSMAWLEYHAAFRDRYGPGALVPVLDLVGESGLGYPAGYLGGPAPRPSWRVVTDRDAYLMALIQQATLHGADEIDLTGADIDALGPPLRDRADMVPPARVELGFAVHAADPAAVDRGEFTVQVTGIPRTPTSMAGRFAHLLDAADRDGLARSLTGPREESVLVAQVSFPPRRIAAENVARTGRLTPAVISLSEHPDGEVVGVDELAVTADAEQMYLVHAPTGRRVVPVLPHALDVIAHMPPLARFIAEVADARTATVDPFDYGTARNLKFVPRIRHGRVILAPARWLLPNTLITATPAASWEAALKDWLGRWRVPARIVVCQHDTRLPLDLDEPADRALLRGFLDKADQLELREDLTQGREWPGRPVEFLVPLRLATPVGRPLPVTVPAGPTLHPGASDVLRVRLSGNPARHDDLLTGHLAPLAAELHGTGVLHWWVSRYRDTIRAATEPNVSLILRLASAADYGLVAARVGHLAADLATRGLPCQVELVGHGEHTGRYGHGRALSAAEQVFATDTTAALAQIRLAQQAGISGQALAAASMAHLAAAFTPEPSAGLHVLLDVLGNATEPAGRAVCDLARRLSDPAGEQSALLDLAGGEAVFVAWRARASALRAYHDVLLAQRDPVTVLRTLLHEHHVRALGVDPTFERATNHAASTAARLLLAQAGRR